MANSPTSQQVPMQGPEPGPVQLQERRSAETWKTLVKSLALLVALWFIGPATLLIAGLIQTWASESTWDAKERWTSVRANAWLSLMWYLMGALLHTQITTLWSDVPWFGAASIFPPILTNLLFRWVIALPLSPALACLLESLFPKTARKTERVLLPEEQAKLDEQRQRSKRKRQQASLSITSIQAAAPHTKQSEGATASLENPPPQQTSLPAREEYNWDEGEGSLKLGGQ